MLKKFSSLLLSFIVSSVSLSQVQQSLTYVEPANVFLEEVEVDTANFIVKDEIMLKNPGFTKVKLEEYRVNVGKVNPLKFKYVSRLGDGQNFVQVMDTKTVEKFNPFAMLNFSNKRMQVTASETIDQEKVEIDSTGMSEVRITRSTNTWANVKIFTSVHFCNEWKWISNSDEEVTGDTIFIFNILSIIDSTVLAPNVVEIRGSFGEKVKFYS